MRGGLRLGVAFLVAGLSLGLTPALAQETDATTNTPAADSIGPRELQGFSLPGTVTRPAADPPAATQQPPARTPTTTRPPPQERTASTASATRPAQRRAETRETASPISAETPTPSAQASVTPRRSSITVDLPPVASGLTPAAATADPDFGDEAGFAPEQGFALWPWLLAAMALGAGGAFLFWRRTHHREAFAGGPQIDAFVAPQPQARAPRPAPAPAPPAKPAPTPPSIGIVSTRLRPWIDLTFEPLRCVVEDELVTFEFELAMLNSGSAPARDVLIEGNIFNAGPTQDEEIQAFFNSPVADGERIAAIPPLKSVKLRPQLSVARRQVRVLEAGGRHVFVPLIAFNAVYRWGGGDGQTSAAYLLGRNTKGEKMAPFRLDLGARVFRGVGQRALPLGVRN